MPNPMKIIVYAGFLAVTSMMPVSVVSALAISPPDVAMESTYNRLAQRAIDLYKSNKGSGLDGRCWIGVAGGPGAGKSTLASAVADRICRLQQQRDEGNNGPIIKAVAVPMDGYNYTREKLAEISQAYGC